MKSLSQLFIQAKNGSEQAVEELIRRFHPLMNKMAWKSGEYVENDYTETSLNRNNIGERIKESQLKEAFHSEEFNILIVADKYQTGFDEPLLHTMFVDKKLKGVKAVQTLSRLNRTMLGKKDTFILDFVNTNEEIQEAFQPFYEETRLDEEININLIYDTQAKLRKYNVYNQSDIDTVIKLVKQAQKKQDEHLLGKVSSQFKPILQRYEELSDGLKYEFRVTLRNFGKWYNYISQLDRTFDMELLEESIFTNYLLKFIPNEQREKVDIKDKISMEYYKIQKDFEGEIFLVSEDPDYGMLKNPKQINAGINPLDDRNSLEEIIFKVNERFPNNFTDKDKVLLEEIYRSFVDDPDKKLINMAKNNDAQMFEKTLFKDIFEAKVMDEYQRGQQAYEKLFSKDDSYFKLVYTLIAKDLYKMLRSK